METARRKRIVHSFVLPSIARPFKLRKNQPPPNLLVVTCFRCKCQARASEARMTDGAIYIMLPDRWRCIVDALDVFFIREEWFCGECFPKLCTVEDSKHAAKEITNIISRYRQSKRCLVQLPSAFRKEFSKTPQLDLFQKPPA